MELRGEFAGARLYKSATIDSVRVVVVSAAVSRDEFVARTLRRFGCEVAEAELEEVWAGPAYDLVVVDFDQPGPVIAVTLARVLAQAPTALILALLSASDAGNRVQALDAGADACLSRPFDSIELQARVRALLRRRRVDVSELGGLSWNWTHRQGEVGAKPLSLSRYETLLLEALLRSPSRIVPRELLIRLIEAEGGEFADNRLYVYLSRLRKKVAVAGLGIRTANGLGYSIVAITR